MNILETLYRIVRGVFGWIATGATAVLTHLSTGTLAIGAIGAISALVVGGYMYFSGGQQQTGLTPSSQPQLGFFDTFWKHKLEVTILIDGALKDAVITPPAVPVENTKFVAIEILGNEVIIQKPKIYGDISILNPVVVIKFTLSGEDGEFRLSNHGVTEFEVKKNCDLSFGVKYLYANPSTFHSGHQSKEEGYFDTAPLRLRITYLSTPTGKGRPPQKIEKITEKIPGLPELPGLPEKIVPDTDEIDKQIDQIKKGAEEFWQKDPDGKAIQKNMKAIQERVDRAEDRVSQEVKKIPGIIEEWQKKQERKKIR